MLIAATRAFRISAWGGKINFSFSEKNNLAKAYAMFFKEFERRATLLLKSHGTGLCYEMAKYSLPTRANTALTANNAVAIYAKENQALASIAFRPWENKSPEWWLMSGYQTVSEYVMKKGPPFVSPVHQRLASIGRWDLLESLMRKKGFVPPPDAPSAKYVSEEADLGNFIKWKSQYKKNPNRQSYYVKNKASIQKIANEKSLYNYASIVINGWIKAAKAINGPLPTGVSVINWPYGRNVGWGSGSVTRVERGHIKMTIENKYADLNGIWHGHIQQSIWNRRFKLMDADVQKLYKDMDAYWDSLKV